MISIHGSGDKNVSLFTLNNGRVLDEIWLSPPLSLSRACARNPVLFLSRHRIMCCNEGRDNDPRRTTKVEATRSKNFDQRRQFPPESSADLGDDNHRWHLTDCDDERSSMCSRCRDNISTPRSYWFQSICFTFERRQVNVYTMDGRRRCQLTFDTPS